MSRTRYSSDDSEMSTLMSTAAKPGRLSSRPPSPRSTSPIRRESHVSRRSDVNLVSHESSWLLPKETEKWEFDSSTSSWLDLPTAIRPFEGSFRDSSFRLDARLLTPTECAFEEANLSSFVSPFDFIDTSQVVVGEEEKKEDSFGQIGNFNETFSVINDSTRSMLMGEVAGESFTFGGGDNRRLMDAEEKKFELSDDINASFSNLPTNDTTNDVVSSLSQSLYFMMNTSRLGSLGNDEFGRPPSAEFRPDLGFGMIASPTKSNRETYVIKTVQADAKGDHRHQQISQNVPDLPHPALALPETSKVKKMPETNAVAQDGDRDEDVFLPSFLEATSAFDGANETVQDSYKPEPPSSSMPPPSSRPPSPSMLPSSSMPPPSRIPKFLPKPKKVPTAVPAASRHSSPMKKVVVKPDPPLSAPAIKIDRPFGDATTRTPEQVQVKASTSNLVPAMKTFPIISDRNNLIWTGVSIGDLEQTVFHLKNSTNSTLRAMLKIRDSDKFMFAETKSSLIEVTVAGGSISDVAVTFCPTKEGWHVGKINIKLPSATKGPGIKAVLRLKGHCGKPDLVLEHDGKPVNGTLELGEISMESDGKMSVRNIGNASGFMQLVFPAEHLIPSPSNFVLGPNQEQVVTFRLHSDRNFIGPLMGSMVMIFGTEVCRQAFKLLGASSANSQLGVELNGNFPGQDVAADDLKALQGMNLMGTDIIPFYKTTKKVIMDFNAIVTWSNLGAMFCPLPIEETLNESQMNLTWTATPTVVKPPATIKEEAEESPRQHSLCRDKVMVKPGAVFFPPTMLGEASSFKVSIENRNSVRLFLQADQLPLPFINPPKPFEVKPNYYTSYPLQYVPTEAGSHKETLTLRILNGIQHGIQHASIQVTVKGSSVKSMVAK